MLRLQEAPDRERPASGCCQARCRNRSRRFKLRINHRYGRVTYELMEGAWRRPPSGEWPDWMDASGVAFSEVMDPMRKVVASGTLDAVDWNAELISGDVVEAVQAVKERPGRGIALGGVALPAMLARHGLIDEYTFVVHPVVAGRGPRLLDGVDLKLEPISGGSSARVLLCSATGPSHRQGPRAN